MIFAAVGDILLENIAKWSYERALLNLLPFIEYILYSIYARACVRVLGVALTKAYDNIKGLLL